MPLHERLIFVLLALVLTISAGIGSIVVVHLLIFLQARGADVRAGGDARHAVRAGAGRRALRRAPVRRTHYHPIWTMVASCG